MAQLGMYVPARKATLSPIDKVRVPASSVHPILAYHVLQIQTRMGAYDNMFASQSTFRVELEEA
jgi:DNA mismatch repair protein MSH6